MQRLIISRLVAAFIVSFPLGWAIQMFSIASERDYATLSHAELLAVLRSENWVTLLPNVLGVFVMGLLFLGLVEGTAWLLRRAWPASHVPV